MKQLAFSKAVRQRLDLLKATILFTFQKDTAYWANNWASVLSTTFYTISMLIFINVLFANIKTLVGYTKNEMLFFFLIGQVKYYVNWTISSQNMQEFIVDVNRGDLDLLLTKPIPALFYITFKRLRIFSFLIRDALPPTLIVVFAIHWAAFHFTFLQIISGIILFVLGQISLHCLQFLAAVPVIWLGESTRILKLLYEVEGGTQMIPTEGFGKVSRMLFAGIIPVIISANFTTSVLLGKLAPFPLILWAVLVTGVFLWMRSNVWDMALRSYTSASS